MQYLTIGEQEQKKQQLKTKTMTTLTVQQLIKHFETFSSNFSVFGVDELSNYATLCKLRRMKKTRVFNVKNAESDKDCILIWRNN